MKKGDLCSYIIHKPVEGQPGIFVPEIHYAICVGDIENDVYPGNVSKMLHFLDEQGRIRSYSSMSGVKKVQD